MSGYSEQEKDHAKLSVKNSHERVIPLGAAGIMLAQAKKQPDGALAVFIRDALNKGWRVDFPRVGESSLIEGYDEHVGQLWRHLGSEELVEQEYGKLIARSLGIELVADQYDLPLPL